MIVVTLAETMRTISFKTHVGEDGLFSNLCDNFCLCKVKCLLVRTFRTILKEETISIDLVSTQKPEEP